MSERARLPNRHRQESFDFFHAGFGFTLSAGFYSDGHAEAALLALYGFAQLTQQPLNEDGCPEWSGQNP